MKEVEFAENIIVYNNGQEAVDGLKEIIKEKGTLPDVIFLDLNMPIMNGWEFLEEYENCSYDISKKTNIYIISSSVDPRDLERVKQYNKVDSYILKPITPDDLGKIFGSKTK
ncbi:response regulator [uncultured Maribacter sp.]|uniref:response regulator n=1 Tax=uncultured Maribacter sp. TaxID=431308 RepID=UPI0030DCE3AA|tara:strand:+ start:653 stop:988 length:336 start_codon:yes stop_codon:yes gene_type:complete